MPSVFTALEPIQVGCALCAPSLDHIIIHLISTQRCISSSPYLPFVRSHPGIQAHFADVVVLLDVLVVAYSQCSVVVFLLYLAIPFLLLISHFHWTCSVIVDCTRNTIRFCCNFIGSNRLTSFFHMVLVQAHALRTTLPKFAPAFSHSSS